MLKLSQPPFNKDDKDRRFNTYMAHGDTSSEYGFLILLSRMCEYVIAQSGVFGRCEQLTTFICIDRQLSKRKRSSEHGPRVWFNIEFLTIRSHTRAPDRCFDDFFRLRIGLLHPNGCAFYSDERPVFADRLLRKTADCWEASWNLREQVDPPSQSRHKWPVRLWIHDQPQDVWGIANNGALEKLQGHPPIDEAILDLLQKEPAPGIPEAPEAVLTSLPVVSLRWRAVQGATSYAVDFSTDGVQYMTAKLISGAQAIAGPDGFCTALDYMLPDATCAFYRVRASRGPGMGTSSEPSPPTQIALRIN
jgi:hypothetical protein